MIVVECAGVTQVGENAGADADVAVTGGAEALVKGFALLDGRGAGGGGRRLQLGMRKFGKRGQARLAA